MMARISEVEYQPVEAACFQLMAEGTNPSFELVYNIIGRRGSSKVVQDMIGRWRKETADRFFARRSHPSLPEDLVAAGDQLIEKIWTDALAKFDSVFAEKLKGLETRLGEMQASVDAAEAVAKNEEKARLAAETDLKVSRAENASLLERIADLDDRLRDATALLAARED
jgi:HEAT repeat protein